MAAAEDRVLKYMADNPGASVTDISDAIVTLGADLDILADLTGVPRADARAAFSPTPAASDSDEGFDILKAINDISNINSVISAPSSFPVSQSPVIMNAAEGVGPNSEYALSASSEDDGMSGANKVQTAGAAYGLADTILSGNDGEISNDGISGGISNVLFASGNEDAGKVGTAINATKQFASGDVAGALLSIIGADQDYDKKDQAINAAVLYTLGPAGALFKGFLDTFGFFDGGSQATPMTPAERELNSAGQTVDQALALLDSASFNDFDNEGEGETVEATLSEAFDVVNALPDSGLEFFGDTKDVLLDQLANSGVADDYASGAAPVFTGDPTVVTSSGRS